VHTYLMGGHNTAAGLRAAQVASVVRRQATGVMASPLTTPTQAHTHAPVSAANLLRTTPSSLESLRGAWVSATAGVVGPMAQRVVASHSFGAPVDAQAGLFLSTEVTNPLVGATATTQGLAATVSAAATAAPAQSWALRQTQGDAVAVIGGDVRAWGANDTPNNVTSAATEWANLAAPASVPSYTLGHVTAAAAISAYRVGGALTNVWTTPIPGVSYSAPLCQSSPGITPPSCAPLRAAPTLVTQRPTLALGTLTTHPSARGVGTTAHATLVQGAAAVPRSYVGGVEAGL